MSGKVKTAEEIPDGRRRTRFFGANASDKARHCETYGDEVERLLFGFGGNLESEKSVHTNTSGLLAELNSLAQSGGLTLAELTMKWLLAQKQVKCVLVGASTPSQVERNAKMLKTEGGVSNSVLQHVSDLTEPIMKIFGSEVDQYAGVSRIH